MVSIATFTAGANISIGNGGTANFGRITFTDANVSITEASSMLLVGASPGVDVTLTVPESGATDDITLQNQLNATGAVLLRAGDNITLAQGSVLSTAATKQITLLGDFGNMDGPGSIMTLNGKVQGAQQLNITGAANNDTIAIGASGLLVPSQVDARQGNFNRLIVNDDLGVDGLLNLSVSTNKITGTVGGAAFGDITFTATGGKFDSAAKEGILVQGSNTKNDRITVLSTLAPNTLTVNGRDGNDTFVVSRRRRRGVPMRWRR